MSHWSRFCLVFRYFSSPSCIVLRIVARAEHQVSVLSSLWWPPLPLFFSLLPSKGIFSEVSCYIKCPYGRALVLFSDCFFSPYFIVRDLVESLHHQRSVWSPFPLRSNRVPSNAVSLKSVFTRPSCVVCRSFLALRSCPLKLFPPIRVQPTTFLRSSPLASGCSPILIFLVASHFLLRILFTQYR